MPANGPMKPLGSIVAGERCWRVGELGAEQLKQLQPDLRMIAAKAGGLWDAEECEAFFRIMRALLLEHAPDLRIVDLRAIARVDHILPVLDEVKRQALAVAEKVRAAEIARLASATPAGRA